MLCNAFIRQQRNKQSFSLDSSKMSQKMALYFTYSLFMPFLCVKTAHKIKIKI